MNKNRRESKTGGRKKERKIRREKGDRSKRVRERVSERERKKEREGGLVAQPKCPIL